MRLTPIACFALLVACGTDDEKTPDTGTTDTTDTVTTPPTPFEGYADADLTDLDVVRDLATLSAQTMLFRFQFIVVQGVGGYDPACPVVDDSDPDHTIVTGGCTDTNGTEWFGTLDLVIDGYVVTATMVDYGFSLTEDCYGTPLPISVLLSGTSTLDYATSTLKMDWGGVMPFLDPFTCESRPANFVLEYDLVLDEVNKADVYSGSGRYADDLYGRVDVQTIGEVEGACSTEAESGVTLLTTADHDVAITYDGAIDCDSPGTSTWALDGAAQGEILGVGCSSAPGAVGWLALAPLLAGLRRRSRS